MSHNHPQKLILLSWVSWSGKTTVIKELLSKYENLSLVNSYTTRPMRDWEVNWINYNFISQEDFELAIENWEFLEYALVHKQYYYWTKKSDIQNQIDQGKTPITEVDIYWLQKIKKLWKLPREYISIFFDIPNDLIEKRIIKRWSYFPEDTKKRIESAIYEREQAKELSDFIVDTSWDIEDNLFRSNQVMEQILQKKSV